MRLDGISSFNWDDLRIISAVCDTASFTRAARILQLNETTVSRRVARLESLLGLTLFDAVDGVRRPTDACRAIMMDLRDMEGAVEAIHRKLRHSDYTSRKFRLTTISSIAEYYLAPHLNTLLADLPELILGIDASDQNADMSRWEADFAIRLGRPANGAFLMRRIGVMTFSLVRPAGGETGDPLLITYPEALAETPEMKALLGAQSARYVRLETSSHEVIRRVLRDGGGVGVLPDFMLAGLREDPRLAIASLTVEREIWLLTQPHLRSDPMARHISEWCAELFARRVV
ncbi:LysR family transcriptional regulator [Paracoccus marinaquae]|uniref:LysR family transcriptional regulator n=1 Tax=Paracoccus marinaquae TaxID=2841926 RepID=A0ABS6AKG5_9RHOB|nr:LysR family transcriptional regulator [Paracoccus marinaquae]MBU3030716.1 LysR family transcriptional regulator [Paracoccus marinaquae]